MFSNVHLQIQCIYLASHIWGEGGKKCWFEVQMHPTLITTTHQSFPPPSLQDRPCNPLPWCIYSHSLLKGEGPPRGKQIWKIQIQRNAFINLLPISTALEHQTFFLQGCQCAAALLLYKHNLLSLCRLLSLLLHDIWDLVIVLVKLRVCCGLKR